MRHNKMAGKGKFLLPFSRKRTSSTFTGSKASTSLASDKNLLHGKSTYFYRWDFLLPITCGVALLAGLTLMLNPTINSSSNNKAYAETITSNPTDYSNISMSISNDNTEFNEGDTVSTNATPGQASFINSNIKISTSKINQFFITVQAAEGNSNSLTGDYNGATIAPLVGTNVVSSDIPSNTWGFALSDNINIASTDMRYNALPLYNDYSTKQYSSATDLADGDYNLKLTFAANISAGNPSDHYIAKAMVSVAADAKQVTTMQEFAKLNICNTITNSMRLKDSRDGKYYWIDKLADGNCWMTQNLDLDIPVDGLKAADTDIAEDWNNSSEFPPEATMVGELAVSPNYWTNPPTRAQSWDPGMYVYINPSAVAVNCGDLRSLESCTNVWQKVNDNYTVATTINKNSEVSSTINGNVYDAHYLVGNYYSWITATAGTGKEIVNANAPGSICPKGWKLPIADEDATVGSFTYMLNKENITQDNYLNKMRHYPLFFPISGHVSGSLVSSGYTSRWFSSTATDKNTSAYSLLFNGDGNIGGRYDGYRYAGSSIRCLVPGS